MKKVKRMPFKETERGDNIILEESALVEYQNDWSLSLRLLNLITVRALASARRALQLT